MAHLNIRPAAETKTVEDLVSLVKKGKVRIPSFQRGLQWTSSDVLKLFDSIYKGYPVGSLLMREGEAAATTLELGPLKIEAPETSSARWVVDGQQRLVSLTAGLARPEPIPESPEDDFVVYFDAESEAFKAPRNNGKVPSTWVPATKLLDGAELSEWIFSWEHVNEPQLRQIVFEAGKRLRQYSIPLYVVTTDDEDLLRDIFQRVNKSGKPMKWEDVYNALYGDSGSAPSTLDDLAGELKDLGMGTPREEQLLSCVVACQGLDVTQNLGVHSQKDPDALQEGVTEALPAIRRVLSFFRESAEIPHLRLLPRSTPLIILTRFFALYPDPNPRSVQLLTRWTWRVLLDAFRRSEPTLKRRGITQIEKNDEEAAVQHLLSLVDSSNPMSYSLPDRFDARSSESRLALLGLKDMNPMGLTEERPLDIARAIETHDRDVFRKIWPQGTSSPANRILLPGAGSARADLLSYINNAPNSDILASHGITAGAEDALRHNDQTTFIKQREATIQEHVEKLSNRMAAWDHTDRPSLNSILETVSQT
jgi:hypothetical protein